MLKEYIYRQKIIIMKGEYMRHTIIKDKICRLLIVCINSVKVEQILNETSNCYHCGEKSKNIVNKKGYINSSINFDGKCIKFRFAICPKCKHVVYYIINE